MKQFITHYLRFQQGYIYKHNKILFILLVLIIKVLKKIVDSSVLINIVEYVMPSKQKFYSTVILFSLLIIKRLIIIFAHLLLIIQTLSFFTNERATKYVYTDTPWDFYYLFFQLNQICLMILITFCFSFFILFFLYLEYQLEK